MSVELVLRRAGSERGRPQVIFVPHAGGQVASYVALAAHLPARASVAVVDRRRRRGERFDDVVDRLVEVLGSELDGAVVVGHSMGALVAVEVIARAQPRCRPAVLVVSACPPPDAERWIPELPVDDRMLVQTRIDDSPDVLADLDLVALLAEDYRCDVELFASYVPSVRSVPVAIEVLCGDADRYAGPSSVRGWRRFTDRPVQLHVLTGAHDFLFRSSLASARLARIVRRYGSIPRRSA